MIEQIFVYPFGLLRLWISAKTKRSFKEIIKDNSFEEVCGQGIAFFLELIGGIGALALIIALIMGIASLGRM